MRRHRRPGAFIVGVAALGEPLTTARVLAAVLIAGGLILMKPAATT